MNSGLVLMYLYSRSRTAKLVKIAFALTAITLMQMSAGPQRSVHLHEIVQLAPR